MASLVSHATPFSAEPEKHEISRRSGNFPAPIWKDFFIHYSQDSKKLEEWGKRVEELKVDVKRILSDAEGTHLEMDLIDSIQRLGLSYHFKNEIDRALSRIHDDASIETVTEDDDLHAVALRFRLLRQHGYYVPCDVVAKYLNKEITKSKGNLGTNVKGVLSLYEAAFVSMRGEDILDKAIDFCREQLKAAIPHLDSPLVAIVEHALELPLHKRVPRLEARHYISLYQDLLERNDLILELAKLDFNILQSLHRQEMTELQRWWNEADLIRKLPFAKDRMVEAYLWPLGAYAEPEYTRGRIFTTKIYAIVSIFDDIYDTYAIFEELQPLTDAIERWDLEAMDQLPEYMKIAYRALYNCVKEIEEELAVKGKAYRVYYLKEAIKSLMRAYNTEAGWHKRGYIPGVQECLDVTSITSTYPMSLTLSFIDAGEIATNDFFDWLLTQPKFAMDTGLICRIVDDLESHQFEQKRDHVASCVECYSKEHNVSEEEASRKLREMVSLAWKDINQVGLQPGSYPIPPSFFNPVVNLLRVMEVYYQYGDGYTFVAGTTKEHITTLLVDLVPL